MEKNQAISVEFDVPNTINPLPSDHLVSSSPESIHECES